MTVLRGFLRFWYDLVIGDDWTIAVSVVCALACCYLALTVLLVPVWVVAPLGFVVLATGFATSLVIDQYR